MVDDDAASAEILVVLLEELGHVGRSANDGPQALAAIREFRPDVVVVDIGIPGMDGFEIARRVRADPSTAHLRLVALTGYAHDGARRQSVDAGFDLHLVKGSDLEDLVRALQEAL